MGCRWAWEGHVWGHRFCYQTTNVWNNTFDRSQRLKSETMLHCAIRECLEQTFTSGQAPAWGARSTHSVPLGSSQKLAVAPALEEHQVGGQAGGYAAMVRQAHGICRHTANGEGPVLVGAVQVSHPAGLHATSLLCWGPGCAPFIP